jgi:hypothetical protein
MVTQTFLSDLGGTGEPGFAKVKDQTGMSELLFKISRVRPSQMVARIPIVGEFGNPENCRSLFSRSASGVLDTLYPIFRAGLFQLDAEVAHHLSLAALRISEKTGLLRLASPADEFSSPVELMGLKFPNRVGLAAGLDKEGNTIDALGRLGFGFVEIGTITPRPQAGNPKPRLFRLIPHEAIINRMGFNNPGIEAGVENVRSSRDFSGVIGFNIGKNKDTPNENAASR